MTKSNKSRQAEFKTRQRKAGLVQLSVWVHKDNKSELIKYANRLMMSIADYKEV